VSVRVRIAEPTDLAALVVLFEAYRSFYDQASDAVGAEKFLADRFRLKDSTIFVAIVSGPEPIGFMQLYPSLSSTAMRRIFVLNDLYVAPEARRLGVGRALMDAAKEYARSEGAVRLTLSTAIDNATAQRLYEASGYERDRSFYQYNLRL